MKNIGKFYYTWKDNDYHCFDINDNPIEPPVSRARLNAAFRKGLMGFIKKYNGTWTAVNRELLKDEIRNRFNIHFDKTDNPKKISKTHTNIDKVRKIS
jgi:hypothetical protein